MRLLKNIQQMKKIEVEQALKDAELTDHELSIRKKRVLKELNFMVKNDKELKNFIVSGYKEGFDPYFYKDRDRDCNSNLLKYKKRICAKKHLGVEKLSADEEAIYQEMVEASNNYQSNIRKDVKELFNNNPEVFSRIVKALKDKYLKIRNIIDFNPHYKCFYFSRLLYTDHLIMDFDNQDEELIILAIDLNTLIWSFYSYLDTYNEKNNEIISRLEKTIKLLIIRISNAKLIRFSKKSKFRKTIKKTGKII